MQADDAVGIFLDGQQLQLDGPPLRCDQRNAFADEGWNDVNDEFIDLTGVEERADNAPAAHHPDIFSFLGA